MSRFGPSPVFAGFPRPGKTLTAAMLLVGCSWVALAIAVNYGGASERVVEPVLGVPELILRGELWRLFTAALVHDPGAPSHVLSTLLGLFFLGPSLEDRWGSRRMALFLVSSAGFAFAAQVVVGLFVAKLHAGAFFGGIGVVEAIAVAWALQNKDRTVQLFFVLPVSGMALLGFVFLMSVMNVIAQHAPPEGLVTPFGGMLAGYLLSDSSPLRRWYLKLRLSRIEAQTLALKTKPAPRRVDSPSLRLIHGQKDAPKRKGDLN